MGRVKKSSVTIPPLFRKEKISGSSIISSSIISTSTSNGSNNRNSNVEPKSIIGRYRKKIGSLIVGEIERIQLSVKSSDVIAVGHEQNKREHHLKAKRSWLQSDSTLQNMECFFLSAMPNSGFSQSIKSMENVLNEDTSNFVKFENILYEELRAYFQYVTNPCDEKMIALSTIAGKDIFGRGNGHMSIAPIVTVVKELHTAAGMSDKCPLTSPELQMWLKDSSSKYEVQKRAPKFDFAEALPLMYEANFGDTNEKCFVQKLRNWICTLVVVS